MSDKKNKQYFEIIAGGLGGASSVLVGHGLDTIKVRLQVMPAHLQPNTNVVTLTFLTLKNITKNEGFIGLYKGVQAPLLGAIPNFALYFFSYDLGKKLQTPALENGKYSIYQHYFAGAFSGFCCLLLTVPIERIKCLLQIQTDSKSKNMYKGLTDCIFKLYKLNGFKSFYKGFLITCCRDVPACGAEFATYEFLKRKFESNSQNDLGLSPIKTVLAGSIAGVSYCIVGMPFDTIKSCYQTASEEKPISIISVYKEITKYTGFSALYRGLIPVIIRAFPATGACFLGYELTITCLKFFHSNAKNPFSE